MSLSLSVNFLPVYESSRTNKISYNKRHDEGTISYNKRYDESETRTQIQ